jgi:hypothetical protein
MGMGRAYVHPVGFVIVGVQVAKGKHIAKDMSGLVDGGHYDGVWN